MKRRVFMTLLGSAAAASLPSVKAQQPAKVNRVAFVGFAPKLSELVGANPINPSARAFLHGLLALGYVDGKNLLLEWRTADGQRQRLAEIIREMISLNVDVILSGNQTVTTAAHAITQTVPIVIASDAWPVELGFAKSLARPGGNITGLTLQVTGEIHGKRIQLLKE